MINLNKKKFSLVEGNMKVKALIWNLPSIITCKPNLKCHKYCYTKKDARYPNVKLSRENNLEFSKSIEFVEELTNAILSNKKFDTCRIHSSGDFYSIEYIAKWYKICNNCPNIQFYAYSKRDDLFNDEILADKPKNLTLIFSIDGLFDLCSDIDNLNIPNGYDKIAVTTKFDTNCNAQLDDNVKCISQCKQCLKQCKQNIIVFKKH